MVDMVYDSCTCDERLSMPDVQAAALEINGRKATIAPKPRCKRVQYIKYITVNVSGMFHRNSYKLENDGNICTVAGI